MRVLLALESSGPGGAERMLAHLAAGLAGRGHEVRVLLLRRGWLAERLAAAGVEVSTLSIGRPLDRAFLASLRAAIADYGPAVLHTHEFTYAVYGRVAARRLGVAHVATAHGENFARGFKRRALGALLLRPARRFRLVAVSRTLAGRLARALALRRSSIEVLANGIPLPPAPRVPTRRPGEPLRLVAVGNLYPVKNHGLLIRAVAALDRRGIPVQLDILGRGQEERSLRALVEAEGVGARVTLQGLRDDVEAFLARSHVLVSSSTTEGLPLSFLEAMARGLPVVASRVGGVPELVTHEDDGLLFDSGDLGALAASLERLAADEPLRRRLGERAAGRVAAGFSRETMLDGYLRLYSTLAAGRGAAAPEPASTRR